MMKIIGLVVLYNFDIIYQTWVILCHSDKKLNCYLNDMWACCLTSHPPVLYCQICFSFLISLKQTPSSSQHVQVKPVSVWGIMQNLSWVGFQTFSHNSRNFKGKKVLKLAEIARNMTCQRKDVASKVTKCM